MTNTEDGLKRSGVQIPPAMVLVIALTIACWVYFLTGVGTGMSVWSMSTVQFPPPAGQLPMAGPPTAGSALPMIGMWWSMMLAMMIPGTLRHFPMAGMHGTTRTSALLRFGMGYAVVWLMFSIAATGLQFGFVASGLVHGMMLWSISDRFSAALLALAGIYQFTGFKTRRLSSCHKISGISSSRPAGIEYGINCLLSSFALMLLLFVGGVMNVYWVVLLTIIVLIEKTLTDPTTFTRVVGLACLAAGTTLLIL